MIKSGVFPKHAAKLRLNDVESGLTKIHGGAEKSDRATSEQVLDPRTRMILLQLVNRNIVSEINGVISTGKEANVYHAITLPSDIEGEAAVQPLHRAIKVYKTSILVFQRPSQVCHRRVSFFVKGTTKAPIAPW